MKPEEIRNSIDAIVPDEAQKDRMLQNITERSAKTSKPPMWRTLSAVAAVLAVLIAVGAGIRYFGTGRDATVLPGISTPTANAGDAGGQPAADDGREDFAAAPYVQFQMKGRRYIPMTKDTADAFGLSLSPAASDIGENLGKIADGDSSLIGSTVYRYLPAGSEAVVAVKTGKTHALYRFISFIKYEQNKDEDAAAYLELFGIRSAADISKIQLVRYTEDAKLQSKSQPGTTLSEKDIQRFYAFYSILKDSSAAYFEKLYHYRREITGETSGAAPDASAREPALDTQAPDYTPQDVVPPVQPDLGTHDDAADPDAPIAYDLPTAAGGGTTAAGGATEPSPAQSGAAGFGAGLLSDSVGIRIYNQTGLYLETIYYPHMGFISRYEISDAFAEFLGGLLK